MIIVAVIIIMIMIIISSGGIIVIIIRLILEMMIYGINFEMSIKLGEVDSTSFVTV
jgi:hypothetical protein